MTPILFFVCVLESPNSPLFVMWKKISKEIISMTPIVLENEVNHRNFEISVKKLPKYAGKFYFQTALSERVRLVFYFLFIHWNTLTLRYLSHGKNFQKRPCP